MAFDPDQPFREIIVELEESGEFNGFNFWSGRAGAKAWLLEHLRKKFQPFYIQCVEYRPDGELVVLWDVEWTAEDMRATREEMATFRKCGAVCVCELFRFA